MRVHRIRFLSVCNAYCTSYGHRNINIGFDSCFGPISLSCLELTSEQLIPRQQRCAVAQATARHRSARFTRHVAFGSVNPGWTASHRPAPRPGFSPFPRHGNNHRLLRIHKAPHPFTGKVGNGNIRNRRNHFNSTPGGLQRRMDLVAVHIHQLLPHLEEAIRGPLRRGSFRRHYRFASNKITVTCAWRHRKASHRDATLWMIPLSMRC